MSIHENKYYSSLQLSAAYTNWWRCEWQQCVKSVVVQQNIENNIKVG
jgi:hypothetical protein